MSPHHASLERLRVAPLPPSAPVRGCARRVRPRRGEAVEHEADRRDVDHSFRGLHPILVVLAETAVAAQPREAALDDPGQPFDLEGALAALGDDQLPALVLLQRPRELTALMPCIGHHGADRREERT